MPLRLPSPLFRRYWDNPASLIRMFDCVRLPLAAAALLILAIPASPLVLFWPVP